MPFSPLFSPIDFPFIVGMIACAGLLWAAVGYLLSARRVDDEEEQS